MIKHIPCFRFTGRSSWLAVRLGSKRYKAGIITPTSRSGTSFNYNCTFQGFPNTNLVVQNIQELTWCAETLEAYNITRCSDYPSIYKTAMSAISIQTGMVYPTITWVPVDSVTDCGQGTVVVSDSATAGEVDLDYYLINFSPVYHQGDPANGIGGYDLKSTADRAFAFDYDGSGKMDHLALYRPGTGTIWILRRTS
jgi:hypothetical protein